MTWGKSAIAILRQCARAGLTYEQAAAQIGNGCTRNMVSGAALRYGVVFPRTHDKLSRASRESAYRRWADPAFRERERQRHAAQREQHG